MRKFILALVLVLMSSTVFAAGLIDRVLPQMPLAMGSPDVVAPVNVAYVPYCVNDSGFFTGINISIDTREPVTMYVAFFDGSDPYYVGEMTVGCDGWTGLSDNLIRNGLRMHSGSMLAIISEGRFWVTQFTFSPQGFSHIVISSEIAR